MEIRIIDDPQSERLHILKTWPEYFRAVVSGEKRFEVRRNDRGFQVGDRLVLAEFDKEKDKITGALYGCNVTYVLEGPGFGIEAGYCVLGIS